MSKLDNYLIHRGRGRPVSRTIENGLISTGGNAMNPLDSITGTIISGIVLAIILVFIVKAIAGV